MEMDTIVHRVSVSEYRNPLDIAKSLVCMINNSTQGSTIHPSVKAQLRYFS